MHASYKTNIWASAEGARGTRFSAIPYSGGVHASVQSKKDIEGYPPIGYTNDKRRSVITARIGKQYLSDSISASHKYLMQYLNRGVLHTRWTFII